MGIKNAFINAKNKVVGFYKKHRTACKIVIGGLGIGATIYVGAKVAKHYKDTHENVLEFVYNPQRYELTDQELTDQELTDQELESRNDNFCERPKWNEKYRETYNKVKDFAKLLELEDGEGYYIEKLSQYSKDNIVSHMIDGDGVYPPNDEEVEKEGDAEDVHDQEKREENSI